MELSERIENLGGGSSAYAGYGGIGLFMVAIFLLILFAAFRQHNNGGDMASVANALGEFHPRENCADKLTWARYANYMDPEVARNHTEIVRQAGDFARQEAVDTGEIKSAVQQQTMQLMLGQERNTWAVLNNQNDIARNQERMFYQAREADRRQTELLTAMNGQFCLINNRVTQIEGSMLKGTPCYVPTQPIATFACGPRTSCQG